MTRAIERLSRSISTRKLSFYGFVACLPTSQRVPPVAIGMQKLISVTAAINDQRFTDIGFMPTVEEILRSWARDSSGFVSADEKVKAYLGELERRAHEGGVAADVELLKTFRQTWDTLASELR
jgi:hypothetical protein